MRPKTTTDNSWTPTWFIMALLHPSQANCLCYRSSTTWSTSLGQLNSVSDKHIPVSSHTCVGQICFWQASTHSSSPPPEEQHLTIFAPRHHVKLYSSTNFHRRNASSSFLLIMCVTIQPTWSSTISLFHWLSSSSIFSSSLLIIIIAMLVTIQLTWLSSTPWFHQHQGRVRRPTWGVKLHHHHHPLHQPSHSDFINLYFDVHRPFCLHLHGHVFSTMLGFRLHSSISTARAGAHRSPSLPHHALVHRWDRTRHRLHFFAYARVLLHHLSELSLFTFIRGLSSTPSRPTQINSRVLL